MNLHTITNILGEINTVWLMNNNFQQFFVHSFVIWRKTTDDDVMYIQSLKKNQNLLERVWISITYNFKFFWFQNHGGKLINVFH